MDYDRYFHEAGIQKGDLLDVAADLFNVVQCCKEQGSSFDVSEMIDALTHTVTTEGTVMIRAFNWDFCKGIPFDIRRTKSQVGALGNRTLNRDGFMRSQHPIYSWMVWGKYQKEICGMENINAFGPGSPFDFLAAHHGKQLTIGKMQTPGYTQMHHIEKMTAVPYRYEKFFDGEYIDGAGVSTNRRYTMYVRRLDLKVEIRDRWHIMEEEWIRQGLLAQGEYDGVFWGSLKLKEAGELTLSDIRDNFGRNCYLINGRPGFEGVVRAEQYENEYKGDQL